MRRPSRTGERGLGSPEAVSRFQDGDPETVAAVRRLIFDVLRTHSSELKAYWDDLVLEVCAQAWRRARRGGADIRSLEGLVVRMTHARVIDLHRHRSRWRLEADADGRLASVADPDPGPYERLRREETTRLVETVIGSASERTRMLWRMIYFEGLKYREASQRLGIPEGTLKRQVYESLRAASKRLRKARPGDPEQRDMPARGKRP